MKVITKLPILLFIFSQSAALSEGNTLFLSVNKAFYEKGETIHFSVTQSSPACNGASGAAYVELGETNPENSDNGILVTGYINE